MRFILLIISYITIITNGIHLANGQAITEKIPLGKFSYIHNSLNPKQNPCMKYKQI